MALTNFDNTTPVTAAYLNGLVNQLPRTVVVAQSSRDTIANTDSTTLVELCRVKLRPVQGNYLHVKFDMQRSGVGTATIRSQFETVFGTIGVQDNTSTTTWAEVTRSVNMQSVDGNDLTCEDCDLVFLGKVNVTLTESQLRSILVVSSDQSSPTSVGM